MAVHSSTTLRVLHLLSQRPSLTGSGVTLDALVRQADRAGWDQRVVVGVPAAAPSPEVGGLSAEKIRPLLFETPDLPFPVPGMSDVMPYASTRFSSMAMAQIESYRDAWRRHLRESTHDFIPDVVHCHHLWILGALVRDVFPTVPVVSHCHATGLRQMELCPQLAVDIITGLRRNDAFLALHAGHAAAIEQRLGVHPERIHRVGAGVRADLFHPGTRQRSNAPTLAYAGKLAHAKGLPWLLKAVESLRDEHPDLVLHVAGGGSGAEADALRSRLERLAPNVVFHGLLDQRGLASVFRKSDVFVLPSFYEGLPLVLVEALACGCQLVCTDLPGVGTELAPALGATLERVPLPRLIGADVPEESDLPGFVADLEVAIRSALNKPCPARDRLALDELVQGFTWEAVFQRVEAVWREAMALPHSTL